MGMLVLSRHKGESIAIAGRLITVYVVDVRGDKVRIGIDAPDDVTINRSEIQDRIDSQERPAAECDVRVGELFVDNNGEPLTPGRSYLVRKPGDDQSRWIKIYDVAGELKCRPAGMQVAGFLSMAPYAGATFHASETGVEL